MQQQLKGNRVKAELKTTTELLEKLQQDGLAANFLVNEDGLYDTGTEKLYKPEEVKIVNFYRFEGESDPADSSILYAIEATDGTKGVLSDSYGPYADETINKFITEVEEISKKTNRDEKL